MIKAVFRESAGKLTGFSISGHAEYDDEGSDIVCAGVSSAVMLICNAATEVFRLKADVSAKDNLIAFSGDVSADRLVRSLMIHLKALSEAYPENISVNISEV